jgi:hypothetical protein
MAKTIIPEIFSAIGVAIAATEVAEGKWTALKVPVAKHYATREGFVAVRPQFIADYIYPNMGKDKETGLAWIDVMQELPRKGNKEYKAKVAENAAYADRHALLRERQKIGRSMGGEFCTRVENATFGVPEKKDDTTPKTPETRQAKLLKRAADLLEAIQKDDEPTYAHKDAIKFAQSLVKSLTI